MANETKPENIPDWASSAGSSELVRPTDDEIKAGFPKPPEGTKGTKPKRKRLNWFFNWTTSWYNYLSSRGSMLYWDGTIQYSKDARVTGFDGRTYVALVDNINVEPVTDDRTHWIRWGYRENDVATSTDVGLVKPDNTTVHVDKNGVLSATTNVQTMTKDVNGIGRPDNKTITVNSDGVFSANPQAFTGSSIETTGLIFQLAGSTNFSSGTLDIGITPESTYQFWWDTPFYQSSMTFEKGYLYTFQFYDVYGGNYTITRVENISIDGMDLTQYQLWFRFDFSNNNQSSLTFESIDGTQKIGWASAHNNSNAITFLGSVFNDSNPSNSIMEKIYFSQPQIKSGSFQSYEKILIPYNNKTTQSLYDLSTAWSSGLKFCSIILIEKIKQ